MLASQHCYNGVRKSVVVGIFFIALLLISLSTHAASKKAYVPGIIVGILPTESPVTLFKRLAPLRRYLSERLAREVRFETARDFHQFIERTRQGKYDVIFTAPHLALLAHDSGRYEMLSSFFRPLSTVLLVKEDSPISSIQDLQGKSIATPPSAGIVTMVGQQMLQSAGILSDENTQLVTKSSHSSALSAMTSGEADVAMVANLMYRKSKRKVALRIVAESHPFPGMGIMVSKAMTKSLKLRLGDILNRMRSQTEGLRLLKKIAQPGYEAANIQQFEVLRPYLKQLKTEQPAAPPPTPQS